MAERSLEPAPALRRRPATAPLARPARRPGVPPTGQPAAGWPAAGPIIVIGMHRSGTGLLADVLRRLGVHMGLCREANEESKFFLRINEDLLAATGAAWDRPQPFVDAWRQPALQDRLVAETRGRLDGLTAVSHLGPRRWLGWRQGTRWGWKDPRNTYTLPLWLKIFPQARVVHIHRNGIDVAASLKARSDRYHQRRANRGGPTRALSRLRSWLDRQVVDSGACRDLDNGFALWESYTRLADAHLAALTADRRLEIGFERLLTEPESELEKIDRFLGGACDGQKLAAIAARFTPAKAHRYRADADLRRFYQTVKDRPQMKRYSYA